LYSGVIICGVFHKYLILKQQQSIFDYTGFLPIVCIADLFRVGGKALPTLPDLGEKEAVMPLSYPTTPSNMGWSCVPLIGNTAAFIDIFNKAY
jgi:hypothetical protein